MAHDKRTMNYMGRAIRYNADYDVFMVAKSDGTDERFATIEKAMGYIIEEERQKNKIKMYFFTVDENGQRNGINSDFFERDEITEPWGKGRGYKHKTTGKMLFKKPIYHEND